MKKQKLTTEEKRQYLIDHILFDDLDEMTTIYKSMGKHEIAFNYILCRWAWRPLEKALN